MSAHPSLLLTSFRSQCCLQGILERLAAGPVIGDGGFVFELEKRGYVKAGPWTPESVIENPEAVRQLHREFLRAGSDVMQAFTFYASEDKLVNRGNKAGVKLGVEAINRAAAELAAEVAAEGDALVLGGLSQCPSYLSGKPKAEVQAEFKKQIDVFVDTGMDFLLCEVSKCAVLYCSQPNPLCSTSSTSRRWSGQWRRASGPGCRWPPACVSGRRETCTASPRPSARSAWREPGLILVSSLAPPRAAAHPFCSRGQLPLRPFRLAGGDEAYEGRSGQGRAPSLPLRSASRLHDARCPEAGIHRPA